jgi:hypothetical protein
LGTAAGRESLGPGPGRVENRRDLDLFNILEAGQVLFRHPTSADYADAQFHESLPPGGSAGTSSLSF